MKPIYLSIVFICISLFSSNLFAQKISKQVIGASGNNQISANFKLSWTTGEPVVGIMTGAEQQLGNGYYPSLDVSALLAVEEQIRDVKIKVYPNPTAQLLFVAHPTISEFNVQLSDSNGKVMYAGKMFRDEVIDVSNYAEGMYLITIESSENNKKNTYKIIKK